MPPPPPPRTPPAALARFVHLPHHKRAPNGTLPPLPQNVSERPCPCFSFFRPLCVSFPHFGFSGVFLCPFSSSSFLVFCGVFSPSSHVCCIPGCCFCWICAQGFVVLLVGFSPWCSSVLPLTSACYPVPTGFWGRLALVFVPVSLVVAPFNLLCVVWRISLVKAKVKVRRFQS